MRIIPKQFRKNEQGFTVLELLVTIAILVVLTSIVLVSVIAARERSRFSAGMQMSTSLFRAYGANSIAGFGFDEPSGNPIDDSGLGVTAALTAAPTRVTGASGTGMTFNGTAQYAEAVMGVTPTASTKWTIAAWVKPSTIGPSTRIFVAYGLPYLALLSSGAFRLLWNTSTPGGQVFLDSPTAAETGKWYFVVASHNNLKTSLYVDGKEVAANSSANAVVNNTDLYIGAYGATSGNPAGAGSNFFAGTIDEVRVYTDSMIASEVRDLYLAGLEGHRE